MNKEFISLISTVQNTLTKIHSESPITRDDRMKFSDTIISLLQDASVLRQENYGLRLRQISATTKISLLRIQLEELIQAFTPPDANCSCHLSPPCSDCVQYGHFRELIAAAHSTLETTKE